MAWTQQSLLWLFVVTVCCLQAANCVAKGSVHGISKRYVSDDDDVPDECKGKNYCTTKPDDYPQAEFDALFKRSKIVDQPTLFEEAYGDRGGDPDLMDDCESVVTFEPLYKVRDTNGQWHTVVQIPGEDYIQRVRLETCVNEGSSCFTGVHFQPMVTTYCQQKTSIWLVVVSDGNNGTEKIKTELPICCSCQYKYN